MSSSGSNLPQSPEWNSYWSLDQTKKFTKISWSKKRIMAVLAKYVQENKKALDAGCGSGFFAKYFSDQGLQTTAFDFSKEALKITEHLTQGKVRIVCGDLLKDSLKDSLKDKYDLIFTDGLLEHFSLQDQKRILQNFISVLNPRGVIVTFVPNRFSPWELIRPFFMPGIEEKPFILKDLVSLQKDLSVEIVEKGGLNTFPFSFSPDKICGKYFGMLLFTVAKLK